MKKIRIFVILFILSFSFSVKAETLFEITCQNKDIDENNSAKCDVSVYYESEEDEAISDIELEYDTNLNIDFQKVDDFDLTKHDNKINIHADTPLFDEIGFSSTIFEIVLSNKENLLDKEKLTFKNIKINNSSDILVDSFSTTFNILKSVKELDSTNTLESITVNENKLNNFDKNKLDYDIKVTDEIVSIDAVRTSDKSSVEGLGKIRVANGEDTIREISVKAENGDILVYKLHITNTSEVVKYEDLSKDNTLKKLELFYNKDKIDFDFDKDKDTFEIEVNGNIDKLKIKAETNDTKATFDKKYGPRDIKLKTGQNKVEIKVYAEDSSFKIYTLLISRLEEKDSDNSLSSLKINGQEVNLDKEDGKYEIILVGDILKTEIDAIANSSKAIVNYEEINLADGDNDVTITVQAENGEEKEYHINVIHEEENKESIVFENIEITGYNIDFSKDKFNYDLEIDDSIQKLDIKVYPDNVVNEIINNNELSNGSKVIVKISDDNGLYEYTINIIKDNLLIKIVCYMIFVIGILALTLSILKIRKVKRIKKVI